MRRFTWFLLATFLAFSALGDPMWRKHGGSAIDVATTAGGTLWVVSAVPGQFGNKVWRWGENGWVDSGGDGVRIAVDHNGRAWVVNNQGQIFQKEPNGWERRPGHATDIGIGGNEVWIIGQNQKEHGFGIHRWNKDRQGWDEESGSGVRISVDKKGFPWIVNKHDDIFHLTQNGWEQIPGKATDIGLGSDGNVWTVGPDKNEHGAGIWQWVPNLNKFVHTGGSGMSVAGSNNGNVWTANKKGELWVRH